VAPNKNPFEVFGLTPEIANELDEEDLFSMIHALYRALHKVYHPDRSASKNAKSQEKNGTRALELNLAYEKLNLVKDSQSFRYYRKIYRDRSNRGLRKKINTLKNDFRLAQEKKSALADCFMEYILHGLPWFDDNEFEATRPLPTPTNLKLGLNDVAINHNIRTCRWDLGSNYKEIFFDALGAMMYRPVGRAKPFPVNFVHLIGTIDCQKIDLVPLLDRTPPREGFYKCPGLDRRPSRDEVRPEVCNTISLEKFKNYCLPLLKPELSERSYLFSVHRPSFEKEKSIFLEGIIVKISGL